MPYLKKEIRNEVFRHIKAYADSKGIYVDFINGTMDHVHCLLSLVANQSLADIMQLLKGESSFWINKKELTEVRFGWQEEYYAESIGRSQIKRVRNYIKNQEIHHKKKLLNDEIECLLQPFS